MAAMELEARRGDKRAPFIVFRAHKSRTHKLPLWMFARGASPTIPHLTPVYFHLCLLAALLGRDELAAHLRRKQRVWASCTGQQLVAR